MADDNAPVPFTGEIPDGHADLFGAYRSLLPIVIEGQRWLVPENNSVLRALQYLELEHRCVKMAWGNYCWNDTKGCCEMTYCPPGDPGPRAGRACQVLVQPGLQIFTLPKGGRTTGGAAP
jgi:hypothetical protein